MTDIRKIFNIKYPIIQGGMANISDGAFAAAVSEAGSLGIIASGGLDGEQLREQIRIAQSLTDKPLAVNLMLMSEHVADFAQVVIDCGIKIVTTGAGNPGPFIPAFKEAGIKIFPVVATCAQAKRVARDGADGVIAEGTESGGHVGEMTTMALVPQVIAAVDIPVIAAGGIVSGEQMLAGLALGACGVQIGTALLVAKECPVHENYRQAIVKARDIDTVVTGRKAGAPVRIIKNSLAKEYLRLENEGVDRDTLEHFTLGAMRKAVIEGNTEQGSVMAGQSAGLIKQVQSISEILEQLWADCKAAQQKMAADQEGFFSN